MSAAQTVAAALGVLAAGFALIAIGIVRNRAEPEQPGRHSASYTGPSADDIYAATIAVKPVDGTPPWDGEPLEPLPPFSAAPLALPAREPEHDTLADAVAAYAATMPAATAAELTELPPSCAGRGLPVFIPAEPADVTVTDMAAVPHNVVTAADYIFAALDGRTNDQFIDDLFGATL